MTRDGTAISIKQLRSFGLLMAGLFLIIGLWPLVVHGEDVRIWGVSIAGLWGVSSLVVPTALKPLYSVWMKFAEKLGWFNTRVLLGIMFYGIFTPFSFIMKIFGKKPLHCQFEKQAQSYREDKSPRSPDHVIKQF